MEGRKLKKALFQSAQSRPRRVSELGKHPRENITRTARGLSEEVCLSVFFDIEYFIEGRQYGVPIPFFYL